MGLNLRRRVSEVLNNPTLPYYAVDGEPEKVQPGNVDADGNLLIAGSTSDMDGQTPNSVNVTAVGAIIVAANADRVALVIVNDSDTVVYVALGENVPVNTGIRLNSNGGLLVLSKYGALFTTEAIWAVHGGAGNKVLTFQEML